jgi:N-acylneuraminate cytidylyltransferase
MSHDCPHEGIIGFVFARGGSKSVPRKNLRRLAGKPLIAHAIQTGLSSRWIDTLIVSTDDEEIAATAVQYGAIVPFLRPAELSGDSSPEWKAWQHAITAVNDDDHLPNVDVFVCIPTTAPLREVGDVDACIETFLEVRPDVVATAAEAHRSPWFNMLIVDDDGSARKVISSEGITRRQDAPHVYDMTTVAYVARPQYVLDSESMFEGDLRAVIIPKERALDIDTEFDFEMAEWLIARQTPATSRLRKAG